MKGYENDHFDQEIMGKIERISKEILQKQENAFLRLSQQANQQAETRLKAQMWFHQDYNPKHYSFTTKTDTHRNQDGNLIRFDIESTLEYTPPKRNGHRWNHPPSDLYKEYAEKLAQEQATADEND